MTRSLKPLSRQLETVIRYYDGCSRGDIQMMMSALHPDVVHYFLTPNRGSRPVRGAENLASYWRHVQQLIDAHWLVDHAVIDQSEVVIEWSMFWKPELSSDRIVTRGSEWFQFTDDRIREIRAYYQQLPQTTQLDKFPYADRLYSLLGQERSAVHDGIRGSSRGSE